MSEIKIDVDARIKLFLNNNVYTFIRLNSGNILNGFLVKNNKDDILFKDDILGIIPVIKNEIQIIDYSKKKVNDK